MKSHPILTFSFPGNKERRPGRTGERQRSPQRRGRGPSSTYVLILLLVAVEVAHHRFGFSSIWPFLAFSLVPTFLVFFIELDLHLNRLCCSGNKRDSNEESQGTPLCRKVANRRCRSIRSLVVSTWFLSSCLVRIPSTCKHASAHTPQTLRVHRP